jgi:hypothetical protein
VPFVEGTLSFESPKNLFGDATELRPILSSLFFSSRSFACVAHYVALCGRSGPIT